MLNLRLEQLHKLPREPGIYIVMSGNECLYVGKSKNAYERWNGTSPHHRESQLKSGYPHCLISFIPIAAEDLGYWESFYIKALKPALNWTPVVDTPSDRIVTRQRTPLNSAKKASLGLDWINLLPEKVSKRQGERLIVYAKEPSSEIALCSGEWWMEKHLKPVNRVEELSRAAFLTIYKPREREDDF
jgi:hypothetical protein